MKILANVYLIVLMALAGNTSASAQEKRVALVVGNSSYQHTSALKNPRADAEDMGAALKRLGFEVVEGIDLDKRAMERIIRQFGLKLQGADIALFFYAGHGLQVSGQNHLLPVDARLSSEGDVDFESIPLNLVLRQMEREAKTSLVLLDACRDNPLARNLARTMGTRSGQISQGLAEVKTGVGTLIGFSTQPGNVALDGAGRNSPYATALLKNVETPGRDISATLVNVRNEVVKATNGKQVPWEHTSLMGQVVFSAPSPQSQTGAANYDKEMEMAFWNAIKDSKSSKLLQTYVDRFPSGTFAGLARAMIETVAKEQTAGQEVLRREDELRKAEEAKLAANQQQRDVERKALDAKHAAELLKAQEDARKAREALRLAEIDRESALKAAESARKAQDDARKATEMVAASVPRSPSQSTRDGDSTSDTVLTRNIQKALRQVGCDPGKDDGQWRSSVREAIAKFSRLTKTKLPSEAPSKEALDAIEARKGRICPLECDSGEKEMGGRCVAIPPPKKPSEALNRAPEPVRKSAPNAEACSRWRSCHALQNSSNKFMCGEAPPGCGF